MQPTIRYTAHAISRQAQRNLSAEDIEFVVAYGRRIHCAGAVHIFLGGRDIPGERAIAQRFGRLEGTVLVLSTVPEAPVVITAYRNRHGLKAIRAKAKYDRRGRSCR